MYFPRLGVSGGVSFLVDTGADSSLLCPTDAILMGVDFTKITKASEAQGIGGIAQSLVEPALIVFSEPGVAIWGYRGDLEILAPDDGDYADPIADPEESLKLPSLLGREVLDRWRIVYQPSNDELTFEVCSSDFRLDRST
mgnify:CR=1 FL=1